jgi:hypothetical protein
MTHPSGGYPPISVHIASSDVGTPAKPARRRYHVIPRTIVLTTDEPVAQLLRPDPGREYAIIIPRTNDVVLCESKGDAQATSNVSDTTFARPNGGVIPKDVEIRIPLITSELWAAAATYPTRVTVLACYCKD